jgi:ubiquinone/menaquinone biosynthesis C-methylase UbiE
LAIAAKRRVGATGVVHGVDPSPEMIARARKKAKKAGADVAFDIAIGQQLPFPDAHFDVVLCTMVLHHIPKADRVGAVHEMHRVLRPGGRLFAVDFGDLEGKKGFIAHLHRHAAARRQAILSVLSEAGLTVVESGSAGVRDLDFALAMTV